MSENETETDHGIDNTPLPQNPFESKSFEDNVDNVDNVDNDVPNYSNDNGYKNMDSEEKPSLVKKTVDVVKQTGNTMIDKVGEIQQQASENIMEIVNSYENKYYIIGGLILVVVVCILVAYGLYSMISYTVFNQSKIVIPETKTPIICNKLSKFDITSFNKTGNGKRRTYTFWIYIHDMNKYNGSYKHVFHIGDSGDIRSASPYVFLDKSQNRLYFRLSSLAGITNDTLETSHVSVQNLSSSDLNNFMKQGVAVPYVPIQRWVHIAIVVNENSNGGTMFAYVDAELVNIVSSTNSSDSEVNINNLDLDKMGPLETGGSFESVGGPGFSGLISKITTFNYDLNNKDIHSDYIQGPLDGMMAAMGLSAYGVRSPVYKLS